MYFTVRFFLFLLMLIGISHPGLHSQEPPPVILEQDDLDIIVNNRVLAKVNEKAITVVDVMKKMDMIFYQQFPQYAGIKAARHQFYMMQWKATLQDMIDKNLVLADAKESQFKVTNGDIRQEMEQVFGPNMVINLDKAGLTHKEAKKLIRDDLIIRRMLYFRVDSKATSQVTPKVIRAAYDEYASKFVPSVEWTYRVISVRGIDSKKSEALAKEIYTSLLYDEKVNFDNLSDKLRQSPTFDPAIHVNISEEIHHHDKDVSQTYKEILSKLEPGCYREPLAQKSRRDQTTVYRIFFVKDRKSNDLPLFSKMAPSLKQELIAKETEKEMETYFAKLEKRFRVNKKELKASIPEDFEPFTLKTR